MLWIVIELNYDALAEPQQVGFCPTRKDLVPSKGNSADFGAPCTIPFDIRSCAHKRTPAHRDGATNEFRTEMTRMWRMADHMKGYMSGARTEPPLKTMSAPIINRRTTNGTSHHFFS